MTSDPMYDPMHSGPTGGSDADPRWWRTTWPLDRHDALRLLVLLLVVIGVGVMIGELLTNWSAISAARDYDQDVAERLASRRTDAKNDLAHWVALIADTPVKVGLSIAIAGWMAWRFRRWHEAVMVGLPLVFEATAFIVITTIVGRPRPDVERLLDSPVNSSFPSGHVAAATVYAALAVVVFWHVRATWARALAVIVAVLVPLCVAWARMYQGMHFLTDVLAGMVLGATSVFIAARVLGPPPGDRAGVEIGHSDRSEVPV
jgi:undecaprenyl-diphosphatase